MTTILSKNQELAARAAYVRAGLADEAVLRDLGPDNVLAIKTDAGEIHWRAAQTEEPLAATGRARRYVASDESVDRMGDIILVSGWSFDAFKKNAQALWQHNAEEPIGTVSDFEKGTHKGKAALLETIDFYEEGLSPKADLLWKLVDAKKIKAVSVGFIPRKAKAAWTMDEEERKALGLGQYGVLYQKQEQLELSLVTIPANANALEARAVEDLRATLAKWAADGFVDRAAVDEVECELATAGLTLPKRRVFAVGGVVEARRIDGATNEALIPISKPIEVELRSAAPTTAVDADDTIRSLTLAVQALTEKHDAVFRQLTELRADVERGFSRVADLLPANAPTPTRSTDPRAFYAKALGAAVEQLREQNGRK